MKKTEAQKIVEAKLNKALNKNDAKAVREACIVLKALYEPEHVAKAECQYWIIKGLESGKSKDEIVKDLIENVGCTEEEADKIYQEVENETGDLESKLKTTKAKLNEALDKNDSKAVREACIVLQAMSNDEEWKRPVPIDHISGELWVKVKEIVKGEGSDEEKIVKLREIFPGMYNADDIQYYFDLAKNSKGSL